MHQTTRSSIRVFESRKSDDYRKILSEVLALQSSSSATYSNLISTSYHIDTETSYKLFGEQQNGKISRVVNIDYIGMAATVLLDKNGIYTRNTHYDRLRDLIAALAQLNKDGIALRMRILLQYPYSLAGQNRILADSWERRSFMGDGFENLRDETQLAPPLKDQDIESSVLLRTQQYCLRNLLDLLSNVDSQGPNRITIRFASISSLICGLRLNHLFFFDPYHYGRRRNEDTCDALATPVVMIDGSEKCPAYDVFCNHFRYIWECDSTFDYDDVAYCEKDKRPVFIRKPEKLLTASKVERLKRLPTANIDWDLRSRQMLQVVNSICPIVSPVDEPEVGFLAAAWEQKPDGSHGPCEPASILEDLFKRGFEKLNRIRVAVLRSELGSSLSRSLFELMNASTFSIIVLTKEIENKFCKPNVYIELGYLLNKNKGRRTFIVSEREMEFVTDIQDITYLTFSKSSPQSPDEMKRVYKELLTAMWRAGIISKTTLDTLNKD